MKTLGTKTLAIGCVIFSALFSTAAFSRGSGGGSGMGMHHSGSVTGGAFGTSPTVPGTNSAGTALSSGGGAAAKGPALGTGDPSVEEQDRKAARMISSICRGC
jgi:hypothetical protein